MNPFVKWAGGKGQLVDRIKELMPKHYNRYYEPFIGGGALLLAVQPKDGCINDINQSLINTYRVIREDPGGLISAIDALSQISCTRMVYTAYREAYNQLVGEGIYNTNTAALFIFLNKHCFNGLYRVNSKGEFNVPWNNKETGASISPKNIRELSKFLKGIEIRCGDFEEAVKDAKDGDFVFFDSPYTPLKRDSFESYTKDKFPEQEHRRLAGLFRELTARGCFCIATNHDTELVRELYHEYDIQTVAVRRAINSDAEKRTGTEVIIRSF